MRRLQKDNFNTREEWTERFREEPALTDLTDCDKRRWFKMSKFFTGGKFLDLGCLNSSMAFMVKEEHKESEVYATDFVKELTDSLKARYPEILYEYADANDLPYEDGFFDYVTAGELIEHMENPAKSLSEWMRVLKKGGWLSLSTPDSELLKQPSTGGRWHIWAFDANDIHVLLHRYGEVQIEEVEDRNSQGKKHFTIIAWVKKL